MDLSLRLRMYFNLSNEYLQKYLVAKIVSVYNNLFEIPRRGYDVAISKRFCTMKETLSGIVPGPVYETEKVLTVERTSNFGQP